MNSQNKALRFRLKSKLFGLMVGLGVIGIFTVWSALRVRAQSSTASDAASPPTAGVARVTREDLFKQVTIPAEFRPYEEVELHAKVSGYVDKMNVDFGDKVKAGELIATLEVPELQDDLQNAQALLEKAKADYENAHLIYSRLVKVNREHPNLVAQQDLDTAEANDRTAAAAIAAVKANVEKFRTLAAYTKITAPFDGIVTRRYADPGSLIQAGTSSDTQSLPLVRVSDNYRLRLDFPVTVDYVKDIQVGAPVQVQVESLDRTFTGAISRFTQDIAENTRTMITEIEVTNADLKMVPGMYARVTLKVEKHSHVLAVPVQAVVSGANPAVYVVNANHQIEIRNIKLGMETPDKYEVRSGLKEGDLVVIGDRSSFQAGQQVSPELVQASDPNENKN